MAKKIEATIQISMANSTTDAEIKAYLERELFDAKGLVLNLKQVTEYGKPPLQIIIFDKRTATPIGQLLRHTRNEYQGAGKDRKLVETDSWSATDFRNMMSGARFYDTQEAAYKAIAPDHFATLEIMEMNEDSREKIGEFQAKLSKENLENGVKRAINA